MTLVFMLSVVFAGDPANADPRFFEQDVRPLLAKRCWSCHGEDKQMGNLRLDGRASVLRGGQSGPAVDLDEPAASLLLEAIRYESLEMPPDQRLPEDEVAVLTRWIETGAVWPQLDAAEVRASGAISDEDRAFWSFQIPDRPASPNNPVDSCDHFAANMIDAFIQRPLRPLGLAPAGEASRQVLARRVYQDVLGLPPTPDEVNEFVHDLRPDAYEALVDRLLARPEFGRKWARHWLDLVRYAESDGFKQDTYRPNAWRFRDFVIDAFNSDLPFDEFVVQQLAGDELGSDDPRVMAATAFLRHGIYEYNQRDVRTQWDNMVNELVDVTADAFLGLGVGCARCHDHKFDPLLQVDYFRMRAFFEAVLPRDDLPYADARQVQRQQEAMDQWEQHTEEMRRRLAEIEEPVLQAAADRAIEKFPKDVRPMLRRNAADPSPEDAQIAALAERQLILEREGVNVASTLTGEIKQEWQGLREQLKKSARPTPLPAAFIATDVGATAPPTMIPGDRRQRVIEPGFPSVLDPSGAVIVPPPAQNSTGRRLTLARWIASPSNPLTARVVVNRLWQRYFGRGLVATTSDFGRLGEKPSHPELLDWLACELTDNQWSLKHVHRLILTSRTYRQASFGPLASASRLVDHDNRWVSRCVGRRLEAEQIRDTMLAVSGELLDRAGGPADEHGRPSRTIYTQVLRNQPIEMAQQFDGPDGFGSVSIRNVTTSPLQSLFLFNSDWSLDRARAMASRLLRECGSFRRHEVARRAYWLAYSRAPEPWELDRAMQSLTAVAEGGEPSADLIDLCHLLLNSNEFIYVD